MEKTLRSFYEGSNADLGPVNMDSPPQTNDYLRWTGAYWAPASFEEPEKNLTETVRNAGFTMLPKGTPVKIVGNTGQEANVIAANATDTFPAHLILNHDLQAGASGEAVIIGFINNVSVPDASIFTGGQEVYLGPAPNGGWTTTRPTGTNKIQKLGIIVKPNPGANTISGIVNITDVPQDLPDLIQPVTYNDGGTSTIDAADGENFVFTLTANGTSTTIEVSNIPPAGTRYELELHLTWTSGAITFPASWSKGEALPSEIGNYVITAVTIDGGTSFKVTVLPEYNVEILLNITTTASPQTFTLPMNPNGLYIATIDWGDGSKSEITSYNDADLTHRYASAGSYTIFLRGVIGGIYFNNTGDRLLVNSVDYKNATHIEQAFYGCNNLTSFSGQTSGITSFYFAWYDCSSLTSFPLIDTSSGTNFYAAWHSCSSLTSFPLIDTSNGTDFTSAWLNCTSLTSFPAIDTSSGTSFYFAWYGCSSLTSFSLIDTSSGTNFGYTWERCSSLTSFPAIDTSSGTNFTSAWAYCSSLTSFPAIDTSSGTNFTSAWYNCTSLTSFPLIDTSSGNNFGYAWAYCSSLTSFPLLDTSSGNNFSNAWYRCSSLTSFPLLDTSSGNNFSYAWAYCSSLTSFPLIDTSSGTNFTAAWHYCTSLTSFPLLDTSSGNNFSYAWQYCTSLTSFPLLDTSSGNNFSYAWTYCTGLTSFPLLDTSSGTNFAAAWSGCTSLTSFPVIDTSSGTSFASAWQYCSNLTSFPVIDTSSGTSFYAAWQDCSSLTSFPLLDTSSSNTFSYAWYGCSSLTSFPAGFFDSWIGIVDNNCFINTWAGCTNLTSQSVENILTSIYASGQSAPASGVDIRIDYNGSGLTAATTTAITDLKGKGWTVTINGVLQ